MSSVSDLNAIANTLNIVIPDDAIRSLFTGPARVRTPRSRYFPNEQLLIAIGGLLEDDDFMRASAASREQRNPSLAALLGYLDQTLLRTLATIRAITDDNQLNDAEKVKGIRTLLF